MRCKGADARGGMLQLLQPLGLPDRTADMLDRLVLERKQVPL